MVGSHPNTMIQHLDVSADPVFDPLFDAQDGLLAT